MSGERVRVSGVLVGESLALSSDGSGVQTITAASLTVSPGEHRTLVILVNFQDSPTEPYTPAFAQDVERGRELFQLCATCHGGMMKPAEGMTTHAPFDAGAAWGHLALQASLAGWHAHGIGGFDRDRAAGPGHEDRPVHAGRPQAPRTTWRAARSPTVTACSNVP